MTSPYREVYGCFVFKEEIPRGFMIHNEDERPSYLLALSAPLGVGLLKIVPSDQFTHWTIVDKTLDKQNTHGFLHEKNPQQDILIWIQSALEELSAQLSELSFIAFEAGPGGFTALRLLCSISQALGFGLGIPLVPISSMEGLAWQQFPLVRQMLSASFIASKRTWHVSEKLTKNFCFGFQNKKSDFAFDRMPSEVRKNFILVAKQAGAAEFYVALYVFYFFAGKESYELNNVEPDFRGVKVVLAPQLVAKNCAVDLFLEVLISFSGLNVLEIKGLVDFYAVGDAWEDPEFMGWWKDSVKITGMSFSNSISPAVLGIMGFLYREQACSPEMALPFYVRNKVALDRSEQAALRSSK